MAATVFETPNEKALSGAAALVMHALFIALLVFSVNWKRPEPTAMVAELWSSLPPVAAPKTAPPPPPKVEPEPPKPQPKAEPKVEPKPVPKVEPKPQPKADIDLNEKKEKERKAREQELADKKKKQEQELAEKKKREAEALKKQQMADAEAKRREQEQAEAHKKAAQAQAAAQAREIDKYKQAIAAKIKRFIVEPPNLQGNPEVEVDVRVLPGGEVLGVTTRKASGQAAWDNAVERAIQRAQPLPLPPADSPIFPQFRELNLRLRPKE